MLETGDKENYDIRGKPADLVTDKLLNFHRCAERTSDAAMPCPHPDSRMKDTDAELFLATILQERRQKSQSNTSSIRRMPQSTHPIAANPTTWCTTDESG